MNGWHAFGAIAIFCAGLVMGDLGDLTTRLSQREQVKLDESVLRLRVSEVVARCRRIAIACDEQCKASETGGDEWFAARMVSEYVREIAAEIESCLGDQHCPEPPVQVLPAAHEDYRA